MKYQKSYRLRVANLHEFNKLISGYRNHAIKILGSTYAEQVAKAAISSLDSYHVGLSQHNGNLLRTAIESVKASHDKYQDGIYAPSFNCIIEFYFIKNAILAVLAHGNTRYQKSWEARKQVIKWGWEDNLDKPSHISQKSWAERRRIWLEVSRTNTSDLGQFKFVLIENKMPTISWNAVQKCIPDFDWRVAQCVRRLAVSEGLNPTALSEKDRVRLDSRVRKSLSQNVDKNSFSNKLHIKRAIGTQSSTKSEKPKLVKISRRAKTVDSVSIDHADIVVASDGRAFMAVPFVGLKKEDRIFIQVGSKDVTFIQNGVLFGTVKDISTDARDYLRGLTSITLVEVGENNGQRLLRAKHTAMLNDISISEGIRRPMLKFRRKSREIEIQEIQSAENT